jgi:hypothetical protein
MGFSSIREARENLRDTCARSLVTRCSPLAWAAGRPTGSQASPTRDRQIGWSMYLGLGAFDRGDQNGTARVERQMGQSLVPG